MDEWLAAGDLGSAAWVPEKSIFEHADSIFIKHAST